MVIVVAFGAGKIKELKGERIKRRKEKRGFMKKITVCFLFVMIACQATIFAQSRKGKSTYYIEIARCNAGQYTKKQWQKAANSLKRGGVAAKKAATESLPSEKQERGDWLLTRITKRYGSAQIDALVLGPFESKRAASAAVNKLPSLLPGEEESLSGNYLGEWSMGCFIILGTRTK